MKKSTTNTEAATAKETVIKAQKDWWDAELNREKGSMLHPIEG